MSCGVFHEVKYLRPVAAFYEGNRCRAITAFIHTVGGRFKRSEKAVAPAATIGRLYGCGGVAGENEGWGLGDIEWRCDHKVSQQKATCQGTENHGVESESC